MGVARRDSYGRDIRGVADICVVPFTGRGNVPEEVTHAHRILKEAGLPALLHGYGTSIEGDDREIMEVLGCSHEEFHARGATRIFTEDRC